MRCLIWNTKTGDTIMAQVLERSNNNLEKEIGLVRQQAVQVAESAGQITLTANEVAEGAEVQLRALEKAVVIADERTASVGETTTELETIAGSTEDLAPRGNERDAAPAETAR